MVVVWISDLGLENGSIGVVELLVWGMGAVAMGSFTAVVLWLVVSVTGGLAMAVVVAVVGVVVVVVVVVDGGWSTTMG